MLALKYAELFGASSMPRYKESSTTVGGPRQVVNRKSKEAPEWTELGIGRGASNRARPNAAKGNPERPKFCKIGENSGYKRFGARREASR